MTGRSREDLALRREALATRASLQRIELTSALGRARDRSAATRKAGALAVRLARSFATARAAAATSRGARPLLVSGGWMLLRALRASPTARWIVGAVVVAGAVWWVARSLRSADGESFQPDGPPRPGEPGDASGSTSGDVSVDVGG
jgi:hypothetical protein